MSCDWCKKFGKDDPDGKFVKGTDNFKKDTLDYHNGNKDYELEPEEKYKFRIKQNYLNICLLLTFFNL